MSEKENEMSPSGNPIYRYTDGEKEWEAPFGEECIQEISDHIEKYIGKIDKVFHEIISDTVHIDVHHVKPTIERPFHTLVTSGMSDLPMNCPEESGANPFMELMVTLPDDWEITESAFKNEQWYWPIRQLKFLARFPHKFNTWLGWGHTIPNGDPPEPFADNTGLSGVILLPSINVPQEFFTLMINPDKNVDFLSVLPLYEEEMNLKLRKGSDALLDKFDQYNISDIIDVKRKNTAKKWLGFF